MSWACPTVAGDVADVKAADEDGKQTCVCLHLVWLALTVGAYLHPFLPDEKEGLGGGWGIQLLTILYVYAIMAGFDHKLHTPGG